MTDTDTEVCAICARTKRWHKANQTAHPFTPAGTPGALRVLDPKKREEPPSIPRKEGPEVVVTRGLPPDSGLRLALLRAGVLTLDQLADADKEIRDAKQSGAGVVFIAPGGETAAREAAKQRHPSQSRGGDGHALRVGHESDTQGSLRFDS